MDAGFTFNIYTFFQIMLVLLCIVVAFKMTKLIIKLGAGALAIMALIYLFQNIM